MRKLTVALLQMNPRGTDQEANRQKGEDFCRRAKAMGGDIALFPEMWNIGYTFFAPEESGAREAWEANAIGQDSGFFQCFKNLAAELNMAIAITHLEKTAGRPRNAVTLIDRRGEVRMTCAKVHTCEFGIEAAAAPGDGFRVCSLDTGAGDVQIGAMICYDREFPESARILMLKGAEIIFVPNACNLEIDRLSQFRARAFENMVGMAMTNYPAPKANGHSIAFSGIHSEDDKSDDMLLAEAGAEEGLHLASFDLNGLRKYRQEGVWGNAYRRPRFYAQLLEEEVREPFIRDKATR